MITLAEIYKQYTYADGHGDKGTAHSYIDVYESIFKSFRYNSTFMEIGIAYGESYKMWKEYFIDSTVIGVDCNTSEISMTFDLSTEPNIIIADATKDDFLDKIDGYKFDIIIDDGSHLLEHQVKSFNLLKPLMKETGLYIIEDVQNIDADIETYKKLHKDCSVIDLRHIKNRYDDVLILYQF